jgi:CBS domain-containing protein
MLLGGVCQLVRAPRRPAHEAIMAAVGPATSLGLGGLLYLAYANSGAWPADVQMGLFYLAGMNVTLGLFNLIPAFPMDGGRVLRAALAATTGHERATAIAAAVGKGCAIVLGGLGLWTGNLLLVLVAVFVYTGAHGEITRERARGALEGLRVIDLLPLLRRPPPIIRSNTPVDSVLPRMRELDRLELIVIDPRGTPLSVIQPGDLEAVLPAERGLFTVGEFASQLPVRHVLVPWDVSANDAIERAAEAGVEFVIVVDPRAEPPDNLVGLVAAEDIARMVTLQTLTRRPPGATTSRPAPLAP